jgi:hypothetical protein
MNSNRPKPPKSFCTLTAEKLKKLGVRLIFDDTVASTWVGPSHHRSRPSKAT